VPVAVAVTVNPVPIIAAIVMRSTRRPGVNGAVYAGTLVVLTLLFGTVALLLFHGLATSGSHSVRLAIRSVRLLVGIGFLIAFALMWARKAGPDAPGHEAGWMKRIHTLGPGGAAVVGALLVNYELETPVLLDILGAGTSRGRALIDVVIFSAIACSVPVVVIIISTIARRHVTVPIEKARLWLTLHERPILLLVFGIIGTLYTVRGLIALA
jgi:hypothetical protein